MKKLKKTLQELKSKEEKTLNELREIRKAEKVVIIKIWLFENNLKIGDKVSFENRNKKHTGILNVIISYERAVPAIKLFKKNGELGTRVIDYSIENIKKID